MRNVPVGARRRKNKNCCHITISDALHTATNDAPNVFHNLKFKPNGTVLSFGTDSSCCESMASALGLAEKRAPNGYYNNLEQGGLVSGKNGDRADDCSTRPSTAAMSNPAMDGGRNGYQQPAMQNLNGFPYIPWPFPWNSAVPLPAIFPPGYPVPYYLWNSGGWNLPWVSPTANENTAASSSPKSPLGKHSRSGEVVNPEGQKRRSSIVVPKTLRIDDPEEAARSSIWSTLGIKYDSISREGLFKSFQPKGDGKKPAMAAATSPLLQANQAALSHSLAFQELA